MMVIYSGKFIDPLIKEYKKIANRRAPNSIREWAGFIFHCYNLGIDNPKVPTDMYAEVEDLVKWALVSQTEELKKT